MLTNEQITHFNTFGFLLLRQAFSPDETAEITRAFETVLAEDRAGRAFDGEKRQAVLGVAERRPLLTRLIESDLIYEAMEQLLGPNFVWVGSDGNLYVGDTAWHPDSKNLHYRRIKVAFYLDPVTAETGCLRVIPGSHRDPLHTALIGLMPANAAGTTPFGVPPRDIPHFPLESQPGDVVMFDQCTWHAAFGGKTGRRMFTFNYSAEPTTAEHEAVLRKMYLGNVEATRTMQYTHTGRIYTDEFLYSDRPRLRSITAKLLDFGFR
jgi:ectoine hydroxylase-related dioxygenase (phytanoyl-CoA dioxygenase family)